MLIDTGVGNDRQRPNLPVMQHLSTGFLGALENAGVAPGDVDVVVNTHLHADHVGWNTQLRDGQWVPTFPNARYLMPEADHRYFAPEGPGSTDAVQIVFSDSIFPVVDQTELVRGDHRLSESLWVRPAAGVPAVFVGDLTHCPIQIPRPGDACAFDVDAEQAAVTRKRIFTEASRRRAAVVPAHYPGAGGATLVARGDRFEVDDWLDLPPI